MWLLMRLLTKKTCTKMYKSIHFWKQKKQMNPMVATDLCKIMRFSRNSSVTMVTIEFFLDSITKFGFIRKWRSLIFKNKIKLSRRGFFIFLNFDLFLKIFTKNVEISNSHLAQTNNRLYLDFRSKFGKMRNPS